jgi:hypothetical protein
MAISLSELLGLPLEERMKLAEALLDSVAPADLEPLVKEFVAQVDKTNQLLDATIRRLEHLDEELERNRAEVREEVLKAHEERAFRLPAAR